MSDIKVVITGDASGLDKATKQATADLGRVGIAAQKTDSSLAKMGAGMSSVGNLAKNATSQVAGMASGLLSGGLISAVTLAGVALFELGKKLFDVTEEQKRLGDALEGGKAAYIKATVEVYNLRQAFNQAENGIIHKEQALKLYNSTLGKTLGQTKDFEEAEKSFIANASNYIKFTLLKAAANTALAKAAEQAFEIERNKQLGATKEGFFGFQNLTALLSGGRILSDQERALFRVGEAQKGQNDFMKIYNALMQQANSLGFNQVAIEEEEVKVDEKKVKSIKAKSAAQAEYNKLVRSGILPQTTGESGALSPGTGATIEPNILVKPKITFIDSKAAGLDEMFSKYTSDIIEKAAIFAEMVAASIEDITENTFIGLGDAIGDALAGEQDVIPNLFGKLMSNVGSQIQELGKFLIKSAITVAVAKKAFQALIANPVAAVAVGIALVALGAILKQQASKQFNGFASGTTGVQQGGVFNVGERGPERIFLPTGAKVQPNNELNAFGGGGQVFIPAVTLSGPDLVIAFNRASQQMGRNN
jgi:hypothetical protein